MSPTPTAAEILARTAEVYATCSTYQDEGEHQRKHMPNAYLLDSSTERLRFSTAFVRPDMFHFGFEAIPPTLPVDGAVGSTPCGVVTKCSLPLLELGGADLSGSLARIAAPSGSTSSRVPRMLMPEPDDVSVLPDPSSAVMLDRDNVEGTECYRIEGPPSPSARSIVAWIDCSSLLLRRVDERRVGNEDARQRHADRLRAMLASPALEAGSRQVVVRALASAEAAPRLDSTTEYITVWRPRINVEIDPSVFEFTQPAG